MILVTRRSQLHISANGKRPEVMAAISPNWQRFSTSIRLIAIVCDCDDTLAPDTTAQLLVACGIEVRDFYVNRVAALVDKGHDPAVAYLNELKRTLPNLTRERIHDIGSCLNLFPGIPQLFTDIENDIRTEYRE